MTKYVLYNKNTKEQVELWHAEKVVETYRSWTKDITNEQKITITAMTPDYLHNKIDVVVVNISDVELLIKQKKEREKLCV